jgi:hypothetical protein
MLRLSGQASFLGSLTYCAEEEMEAYRMHNKRSFDPMAAFLSGGDDVSADTV